MTIDMMEIINQCHIIKEYSIMKKQILLSDLLPHENLATIAVPSSSIALLLLPNN